MILCSTLSTPSMKGSRTSSPRLRLHAMLQGLEAISGDEDPHVNVPQQRHVGPFDDHDLDARQAQALGRHRVGGVVDDGLVDRSRARQSRVHVCLEQVESHLHVGTEPVGVLAAPRVVGPWAEARSSRPDRGSLSDSPTSQELLGQGRGGFGLARTGLAGDGDKKATRLCLRLRLESPPRSSPQPGGGARQ